MIKCLTAPLTQVVCLRLVFFCQLLLLPTPTACGLQIDKTCSQFSLTRAHRNKSKLQNETKTGKKRSAFQSRGVCEGSLMGVARSVLKRVHYK